MMCSDVTTSSKGQHLGGRTDADGLLIEEDWKVRDAATERNTGDGAMWSRHSASRDINPGTRL